MKIVSKDRTMTVESTGFTITKGAKEYIILDIDKGSIFGRYSTEERAKQVFDEMARNFIRPNKECYYMPQE